MFARYASFVYLGNSRYGFAAASQFYFGNRWRLHGGRRGEGGAARGNLQIASVYAPVPATLGRCAAVTNPGTDGAQWLHRGGPREALPGRTGLRSGQERDRELVGRSCAEAGGEKLYRDGASACSSALS